MNAWAKGLLAAGVVIGLVIGLWITFEDEIRRESPAPVAYELLDKFEAEGVPDFEALRIGGGTTRLSQFKGKVIVLSFWATWCAPCIEELPSLLKMAEHFKGEVVLVGVSADQRQEDVLSFLKMFDASGSHFMNLWDPSTNVAAQYGTNKIPENYVIGRDFKLKRKLSSSEDWMSEPILNHLRSLLAQEAL